MPDHQRYRKNKSDLSAQSLSSAIATPTTKAKEDYKYKDPGDKGLSIGPGYFPPMQVSFGIVRATPPCNSTEFGIKSQVWNQASGLCNFGPLPKPKAMRQADKRGDSITSGTMNTYFTRTSVIGRFGRGLPVRIPTIRKEHY